MSASTNSGPGSMRWSAKKTVPSSLWKSPAGTLGSRSSTVSDGRQSFTRSGVTTIGLLIRIGCTIMASSRSSSVRVAVVEAKVLERRSPFPHGVADGHPHPGDEVLEDPLGRRRLQVFRSPEVRCRRAGIRANALRDVPQSGLW